MWQIICLNTFYNQRNMHTFSPQVPVYVYGLIQKAGPRYVVTKPHCVNELELILKTQNNIGNTGIFNATFY